MGVVRWPVVLSTVADTSALLTGQFVVFTFIAPYVEAATGVSGGGILAAAQFVFGAAAVVGNAAREVATDRIGARRTVVVCLAGFVVSLLALWLAGILPPSPSATALGAVALAAWGLTGYGFALGGMLGASALDAGMLDALPLIGAAFGAGTLLLALAAEREEAPVMPASEAPALAPIGPPADCVPGWGTLPCPPPPARA